MPTRSAWSGPRMPTSPRSWNAWPSGAEYCDLMGSVFLNVGDTYFNKSLLGIPQIEWQAARATGSSEPVDLAQGTGMPDPVKNRLRPARVR